jgi:hypothetical protein
VWVLIMPVIPSPLDRSMIVPLAGDAARPASLRSSPPDRSSARRWASIVGPLQAKLVKGGRFSRTYGPGAHSRASKNQLVASLPPQ